MIPAKHVKAIRERLLGAQHPLFFHDNDPDGLCSYLLLRRYVGQGYGVVVKSTPLAENYAPSLTRHSHDLVIVLDIAVMEQVFVDHAQSDVIWIDHHDPISLSRVSLYNAKKYDPESYYPTSALCYEVTDRDQDMWLAAVGIIGDYAMPDFFDEFAKKYPLLAKPGDDLDTLLYKRKVGVLVRLFSFLLKGKTSDVKRSIARLLQIKHPNEILKGESEQGEWLWRRFMSINKHYEKLLALARKKATSSPFLVFVYDQNHWSFTADLANELVVRYPKKVVIVAREHNGQMKCSLRAKYPISEALSRALYDIEGRGGGHPCACGAVIAKKDWERFLKQFREELR